MGQGKKEQIFLKNYVEELVSNTLDKLSKEGDFCTCPRCRLDIMAYALNHIPPNIGYPARRSLYKISYLEQQLEVDVTIALWKQLKSLVKIRA